MAPARIEDDTIVVDEAEREYKKDKNTGVYKEAFAQSAATTNYENEINGENPAKYPLYLPCKP